MSAPTITVSDFVQFLELVPKPQLQAVFKLLDIDEARHPEHALSALQIYLLLKNYAPIENVLTLMRTMLTKHTAPLISVVVINKSFVYSQDNAKKAALWSLETTQQVPNADEAVPIVVEQHGVDMQAAKTIWTEKLNEYINLRQKAEQAASAAAAATPS